MRVDELDDIETIEIRDAIRGGYIEKAGDDFIIWGERSSIDDLEETDRFRRQHPYPHVDVRVLAYLIRKIRMWSPTVAIVRESVS
jgi:hypothetical protein